MMLRTTMVLTAGWLAGAVATAATPPVAVEPRDDALGLGRAAVGTPAASARTAAAPVPANNANNVERPTSGNPLWAIPLRQLSATRERPLFAPSRRPPPPVVAYQLASAPPPPPPKPAEPEKPRLDLVGTIAGAGEAIGVFFNLATRSVLRLKMGEAHEGWVLREVRRRDITLVKGSQVVVLALPAPEINKAAPTPGMVPPQRNAASGSDGAPARRDSTNAAASEGGSSAKANGGANAGNPPQAMAAQGDGGQVDAARVNAAQAGAPAATFTPPAPVFPQLQPATAAVNPFHLDLIRR